MKIHGSGEAENLHKALQKESVRRGKGRDQSPAKGASSSSSASRSDAVEISPKAKLFGKLRAIPEIRSAEVERIRAKLEDGSLVTPEALRDGVEKMLKNIL
jgi:flagellar biosynthesis anti-sigma factor FlgM